MDAQGNRDREHLKVLAVLYFMLGGLLLVASCLCLIIPMYFVQRDLTAVSSGGEEQAGAGHVMQFIEYWAFLRPIVIAGLVSSLLFILTGGFLLRGRHRLFCIVVAGLVCLWVPLGTLLGVFALIVLSRVSVAELMERGAARAGEAGEPGPSPGGLATEKHPRRRSEAPAS